MCNGWAKCFSSDGGLGQSHGMMPTVLYFPSGSVTLGLLSKEKSQFTIIMMIMTLMNDLKCIAKIDRHARQDPTLKERGERMRKCYMPRNVDNNFRCHPPTGCFQDCSSATFITTVASTRRAVLKGWSLRIFDNADASIFFHSMLPDKIFLSIVFLLVCSGGAHTRYLLSPRWCLAKPPPPPLRSPAVIIRVLLTFFL